ncbi:MAG TPA: DUF58 domain-containing protein [archaeon]|nr:DUF58 domain-containing protein [archaeon]
MRQQWKVVLVRGLLGLTLFLFSLLPIKDLLMGIRLGNPNLDLAWVIFALVAPHLLRAWAIGLLVSAVWLTLKMVTLPRSAVEREVFRLRKKKLVKNLFYTSIFLLPLLFPVRAGITMGAVFGNLVGFLPPYLAWLALPLLLTSYMDVALFAEAFLLACFLMHLIKILSLRFAVFTPELPKQVFEAGAPIHFSISASSPLPLLSFPQLPFKNLKVSATSSFFRDKYTLKVEAPQGMPVGYYRFDVLSLQLATFPFFFSKFFRATDKPAEITVLPHIKVKNAVYVRNPFQLRETGDLIKKVSGSSLEFAGIRDFAPGDPLSRIWWKGLAKGGDVLLKKDFYSLAEDRWVLVVDLSNPKITKEDEQAMMAFCRAFVEIFTRKDIEVAIYLINPDGAFMPYSTKKRDLLSFLIKHWDEFRHLSHEGAKAVLRDAIGREADRIETWCRKAGISFASFLIYDGLLKKPKKMFYWKRSRVFDKGVRELMTNLNKSGKLLFITPGLDERMVDEVRKVAQSKKCALLFTSFDKVPKARTYVIPRKNPEKVVWRLMYA